MRRMRRTPELRRLVQETHLVPSQLVWPLFVRHGEGVRNEVSALPGVFQTSVDELAKNAERAARLGLGGVILFRLPEAKDGTGSEAYDEQGIVQQAIRAVSGRAESAGHWRRVPCEYTDHGHCGVIADGDVDNDASVYLRQSGRRQARAGVDIVAPSDMMDGGSLGSARRSMPRAMRGFPSCPTQPRWRPPLRPSVKQPAQPQSATANRT
jgi:porphobilinogen synthase